VLAAVVDDDELDGVRDVMKGLREGKAQTLHWRHERPERWPVIASAVAALPAVAMAAICLHDGVVSSERARRYCLSQLLVELAGAGVDRVVMESRRAQDDNDLRVLHAWRRFGRPGSLVRMDFLTANDEPVLWSADCVASAVNWWLSGDSAGWSELESSVRVVEVELP
jgi:hypothetical protein